jgi:hypothetical protein
MAPIDAEMAARRGLSEDMDQIAKDLAGLRADLQGLTGDVKSLGGHQLENMQDTANAALEEVAQRPCAATRSLLSPSPLAQAFSTAF